MANWESVQFFFFSFKKLFFDDSTKINATPKEKATPKKIIFFKKLFFDESTKKSAGEFLTLKHEHKRTCAT